MFFPANLGLLLKKLNLTRQKQILTSNAKIPGMVTFLV